MADNVVLNAMTGGATVASDEITGAQHQLVKVEFGADGVATPVDATNPLPISLPSATVTTLTPPTATEDVAHSTGAVGVMSLAVRDDTAPVALSGTDGDYEPFHTDGYGSLWVSLGTKLSETQDSITIFGSDDGGTSKRLITTDAAGNLQVDVLSAPTTTVAATDLDIRPLVNTDVVTAELSAVDNAVLDTIAAKDFATQTTLAAMNAKMVTGTDIGDVTINNSTGAAAVNIQDGGNAITVDNGGTFAVQAAATLAAETTKVIGTVRVASGGIASGSIASGAIASGAIASGAIAAGAIAAGATSIATTEDTASAAADHLVKIAAIRRDTPVANDNTSADGDYTQLKLDNFGKLWTSGSAPEDVAHVAGEALTIGGVRRLDTPATSAGTSGDWATMDASAEGALWTTLTPTTTGGCTIFRSIDLDESEEEVKATAGNLYGYFAFNAAATTQYLKFYNATAANVTVGTTTPVLTLPLPAGSAANISFAYPIGFSTAITAAATTGIADNDTGAPAANSVVINIFYK